MPQQDDYNSRSRSLMVVGGSDEGWTLTPGEPGMPQPGDLISGKYRIDHMVGRGGMGAVFRATHVVMDKPVAVKWMTPELGDHEEARERFAREARAAARIRHPNVVDVYDVGTQGSALYMVMELLEGESFETLVTRGDVPIPQLLQLLVQAMRGVAAAHAQGVVHRDIKPDNIFIIADATQSTGRMAKVLDFGISKLSEDPPGQAGLTKSGMTMGTPAYMSLEQMNGARDVDARADVYAFGVLLYRTLTGRLPFDGETFGAVAVAIATHHPPPPRQLRPELPHALDQIVMQAIARNRDQRFGTLQELIDALQSLNTAASHALQVPHTPTSRAILTPVSRERPRLEIERSPLFDPEFEAPAPAGRGGLRGVMVALGLAALAYAAWSWVSWPDAASDANAPPVEPASEAPVAEPPPPVPPATKATKTRSAEPPRVQPMPSPATPTPEIDPPSTAPAQATNDPAEALDRPSEDLQERATQPGTAEDSADRSAPPGAATPEATPEEAPLPQKATNRRRRPREAEAKSTRPKPPVADESPRPSDVEETPAAAPPVEEPVEAAPESKEEEGDEEGDEEASDEEEEKPESDPSWHRSGGVRLEDL